MPINVTVYLNEERIEFLTIERLEDLQEGEEEYMYRATLMDRDGSPSGSAEFSHFRDHNVWILIQKALLALAEKHELPLDWGK